MRFIQTYKSPNVIGIGDNVRYKIRIIKYLLITSKAKLMLKVIRPKSNRTILIDDNDNRIVCDDYKQLIIEEAN